jgi:hypothetical protein
MRAAAIATGLLFCSGVLSHAEVKFKPAEFQGLILGRTKIEAFEAKFGKARNVVRDGPALWLYYRNIGPVAGKVEVIASARTRIIETIVVYPTNLSLDAALRLFGPGYREARFSFDMCLGGGGSIPVYESPQGEMEVVLYDGKGLALLWSEPVSIEYLSEPFGAKTSKCGDKKKRD